MRFFLLLLLFPFISQAQESFTNSKDTLLMGSAFTFTAIHSQDKQSEQAIIAAIEEVVRIEELISSWRPSSQTSQINKLAGVQTVKVDYELFQLIERSQKIAELTNGYFDISFASIDKLWQFNGQEMQMPHPKILEESVRLINYLDIHLNQEDTTVFLKQKGMKIGFGAIGKGYAADRAKHVMLSYDIENGVVNAGGDILAWGKKSDGSSWNIGIADPNHKSEIVSSLQIEDQAVVTSGDYERFVLINGERFGHIINPKTGIPVQGVLSVTIVSQTAELADALATAVFVLGEKDGMDLINHLNGVEGIILTDKNKLLYSKRITLNRVDEKSN